LFFKKSDNALSVLGVKKSCAMPPTNGAEFLSAIPGSVGGALAMNAGAFGFEIWSLVESVTTINTYRYAFLTNPECLVAYQSVETLNLHQ
jgi:UDP-N-acetylmuramate dehydrogenase